jgi:hypothetical protein
MDWVNAFLASWYSAAYAAGGILSLTLVNWISKRNLIRHELLSRKFFGYAVKAWVVVFLLALSMALFYGAYQITVFERYFIVNKMPVH